MFGKAFFTWKSFLRPIALGWIHNSIQTDRVPVVEKFLCTLSEFKRWGWSWVVTSRWRSSFDRVKQVNRPAGAVILVSRWRLCLRIFSTADDYNVVKKLEQVVFWTDQELLSVNQGKIDGKSQSSSHAGRLSLLSLFKVIAKKSFSWSWNPFPDSILSSRLPLTDPTGFVGIIVKFLDENLVKSSENLLVHFKRHYIEVLSINYS